MAKNPKPEDPLTRPSIYDGDEKESEKDLWFLPDETTSDVYQAPLPSVDRRDLLDPDYWFQMERDQSRLLANAAASVARLDQVAAVAPDLIGRAALTAASDLSWATGARVAEDRLALYDLMHVGGAGDHAARLASAHWVYRRLGGPAPQLEPNSINEFLGRHLLSEPGLADRPVGPDFEAEVAAIEELFAHDLHPLTRAHLLFRAWTLMELGTQLEGATLIARLTGDRVIPFVPLDRALSGNWYQGIADASETLRARLQKVVDWSANAAEVTSDLSGKTPPALINVLRANPAVSAEGAAKLTGASTAGIRRNFGIFEERRLVQEITGQGRFRVWRARI